MPMRQSLGMTALSSFNIQCIHAMKDKATEHKRTTPPLAVLEAVEAAANNVYHALSRTLDRNLVLMPGDARVCVVEDKAVVVVASVVFTSYSLLEIRDLPLLCRGELGQNT